MDGSLHRRCGRFDPEVISMISEGQEGEFAQVKSATYQTHRVSAIVDVHNERGELPKILAAFVLNPTATVGVFCRVCLSVHMLESAFGGCADIEGTIA